MRLRYERKQILQFQSGSAVRSNDESAANKVTPMCRLVGEGLAGLLGAVVGGSRILHLIETADCALDGFC